MTESFAAHRETADIETASADYATRFAGPVGAYFLAEQSRITLALLQEFRGGTVLDVGGGHCQLGPGLVAQGFALTITGSAPACAARPEAMLPPGSFTFQVCDSLALPYDDNAFDVVLSFRLLPHVDAWQQLLAELCRVARKAVIIDYPDLRSFNILYRLLFRLKRSMEGNTRTYTMYTRKLLRDEFMANGFAQPQFVPEFFWPMVLHRKLGQPTLSRILEWVPSHTGLTSAFGSPIICLGRKQ